MPFVFRTQAPQFENKRFSVNSMYAPVYRSIIGICFLLVSIGLARADWPEFRGSQGDGHAPKASVGLPLNWDETNHVSWKTPIPHKGWSTPLVMNGQVWLTT